MLTPRAILFDLDDTLLASGDRLTFLHAVADEFRAEIEPASPAELAQYLERRFVAYWADPDRQRVGRLSIAEARRALLAEAFEKHQHTRLSRGLAHRFADRFTALRQERLELFPTARETLFGLRQKGVALALVTNGAADTQRAKIERFSLAPMFDHIQIEGEHGFGKPEERAYRHALSALRAKPRETWMVGDHLEWEVAAPQRLGIFAIWHDPDDRGIPDGSPIRPDRIIRQLAELLKPEQG